MIKGKGWLIFLLTGLILGLAFSPQSARAWSTRAGPGAQTVPTAPPTPPTPTASPTQTQIPDGGSDPQPAPNETAQPNQPAATAAQSNQDLTAYPVLDPGGSPPDAYPVFESSAYPIAASQAAVKETQAGGENVALAAAEPTAAKDPAPQPAGADWIGYAIGGTALVGALAIWIFRRRTATKQ